MPYFFALQQVEGGQAPKEMDRVDKPLVHFRDGTSLNNDGTIQDIHKVIANPSNKAVEWLNKNGWEAGLTDIIVVTTAKD